MKLCSAAITLVLFFAAATVRLTNRITGDVFYARTHNHSTMGIAYSGQASTNFDVSSKTETGLSDLQVVVNGIASAPVTVNVR